MLQDGNSARTRVATSPPAERVGGPRRTGVNPATGRSRVRSFTVHGDRQAAEDARARWAGTTEFLRTQGRAQPGISAAVNHFRVPVDWRISGSRSGRVQEGDRPDAPGAGGCLRSMASRRLARSDDLVASSGAAILDGMGLRSADPGSTPTGRHARSTAGQSALETCEIPIDKVLSMPLLLGLS